MPDVILMTIVGGIFGWIGWPRPVIGGRRTTDRLANAFITGIAYGAGAWIAVTYMIPWLDRWIKG